MKKLIKDDIYNEDFYFITCEADKINQVLERHYKTKENKGKKPRLLKDSCHSRGRFVAIPFTYDNDLWYNDLFIFVDSEELKNRDYALETLTHELNHLVDYVFDGIGMLNPGDKLISITEARAYYFSYLLKQILKHI